MSGSEENLDIDPKTLRGMVDFAPEAPGSWGWNPTTFVILALMDLHQRDPNPKIVQFIGRLVKAYHAGIERVGDDRAYYKINVKPEFSDGPAGHYGYGAHVRTQGDSIRMLTRWCEISGDRESLKLAGSVVRYVMENKNFWTPEAESKAVVGLEHAHFSGHPHEYSHCLMGILCYARATNDARLKQFVRDGYEYLRNFGIARIGLFGETCATADMVCLAIHLSDAGVGDYWEDVDQYVRNMLADRQITDAEKLRRAAKTPPILSKPVREGDPRPANARWSPMGQCYDPTWNSRIPLDPEAGDRRPRHRAQCRLLFLRLGRPQRTAQAPLHVEHLLSRKRQPSALPRVGIDRALQGGKCPGPSAAESGLAVAGHRQQSALRRESGDSEQDCQERRGPHAALGGQEGCSGRAERQSNRYLLGRQQRDV